MLKPEKTAISSIFPIRSRHVTTNDSIVRVDSLSAFVYLKKWTKATFGKKTRDCSAASLQMNLENYSL